MHAPEIQVSSSVDFTAAAASCAGESASLRSLQSSEYVQVAPSATLRDALYRISQGKADAVVVTDQASRLPLGLLTLRELLHVISFEQCGLDEPVAAHMTGAPQTVAADSSSHRARVLMANQGVGHLVVVEPDGSLYGLLSRADLLGLRAGGAEALMASIAAARDVQAMAWAAQQVRQRGAELFADGMGIEALCEWMSSLNDLIAMRVIELISDEFDLPGVSWCWMLFGSEGRLEQTFTTDQDNGLIFQPSDPGDTESLRTAFLPFAKAVNKALHYCGFERCRGKIMASNPQWCLSAQEWQARFAAWLRVPDPEALLRSTIFFDFRPLYGGYDLVDQMRGWLMAETPGHPRFLRALAEEALSVSPPVGWAGQFVYGKNRQFPRTIDLKLHGARLFVDAARIWSLAHGIRGTGTAERLRAAGRAAGRSAQDTTAEVEAFHWVQRFRIQQQLTTRDHGRANRVDPANLNELHRLMLKEALKQARKVQLRLRQDYGL
jgi:CBS domain-containing protein